MKLKKFLSLFCVTAICMTIIAGCGREAVNPVHEDDNTAGAKMQLYVSNYEGGFGKVWLEEAAKRFEELHKDDEFSNGRKGVDIKITSSINGTAGSNFVQGLGNNTNDVFFTEDAFYYDVMAGGYALDITDVVTETLSGYGENRSVEDKMDQSLVDFFKTSEGKYYGLPHYETYYGIVYNVDVFDQKGLWISTDGSYIKPGEGTKANGPDGKPNTYDDGLPATFAEFYALCDYMTTVGVTPFVLPGSIVACETLMLYQLYADYEGRDNFLLNYTFDGEADDLVNSIGSGLNANGTYDDLLPATKIDSTNGYLVKKQAGLYAALEFAKNIVDHADTWCTSGSFLNSEDHLTAKHTYLKNGRATQDNLVAFLVDGVWWENEAEENNIFATWEPYGAPTRETGRFAIMPFPKASEAQVGETRTIATNCNLSLSFIHSRLADDPEKAAIAKEFLKFLHTDEEMQNFSVSTGTLKPFRYTIPEAKKAQMSYFGKSVVDVRENDDIDTVYAYSGNSKFLNNFTVFYPDYMWANHHPFADLKTGGTELATVEGFYNFITSSRDQAWWDSLKG